MKRPEPFSLRESSVPLDGQHQLVELISYSSFGRTIVEPTYGLLEAIQRPA